MAVDSFLALESLSEYCDNLFFSSPGSDVLLVFLPSVNGKDVYPYYPRKSWAGDLVKKYHVLYVSDPYQPLPQYKEPMGSWFISPNGELSLDILAKKIIKLKEQIGVKEVIFYGSSMGGYAAIILASLVIGAKAVSECPQLYLKKHPGSRFVLENILCNSVSISDIEPLAFVGKNSPKHIRLICSVFDRHYAEHILPFIDDVKASCEEEVSFNITLQAYVSSDYKKGHVAMSKGDALRVINEVSCL